MERKIEFNVTGKERGLLAKAIGEFLGVEVRYLRVPACNYDIGGSILVTGNSAFRMFLRGEKEKPTEVGK